MNFGLFKAGIGFTGSALALLFGGWDAWLQALVTLVILDYVSGVLAGAVNKKLSSAIGIKGIAKKLFIFILVAAAVVIDTLTGKIFARLIIIGFFCSNEMVSILENADKIGLPIPQKVRDSLLQSYVLTKEGVRK